MKRVGSKGHARALRALRAGEGPPSDREDDDEDDERDDAGAAEHGENIKAAATQCRATADAYEASAGGDLAAMMHAHEQSASCRSACLAAETSSAKLRGAEPPEETATPLGTPPPMPGARALLAALPPGAPHLEVLELVALGRHVITRAAVATIGAAKLWVEGAAQALGEVGQLRAADARRAKKALESGRRDRLAAAVLAGMPRAHAFDVSVGAAGEEVLTPKKCWTTGTIAELSAQLDGMGWKVGAPPKVGFHLPVDSGGEAGLAARAAQSGMTLDERRAAEANVNRAPPPPPRELRTLR